MSMHKSGRNDTITPGASCDLKLADYINRKSKHDALMNSKPKMTFDDWWSQYAPNKFSLDDADSLRENFNVCWQAAQENS